MYPQDRRVGRWNERQDELFAEAWNSERGRYRSRYAFRGLSDRRYSLATTLRRLGGDYGNLEPHLLRNFKKYAHRSVAQRDFLWHWLSVAQHYGLPTRLLNWTYPPLVALHFATANITERVLFPGLDDLGNWLKRHYSPKDQSAAEDKIGTCSIDERLFQGTEGVR